MSVKILVAPRRYVQGPGALAELGSHLRIFGIENPLILASPSALKACRETIVQSLSQTKVRQTFIEFSRECTFREIKRVKEVCLEGEHDAIISCGGGKTMDTGRAAAAGFAFNVGVWPPEAIKQLGADVPCIQVPTIAASDAATASLSVVYNDRGSEEGTVLIRLNPAMVLVDTAVIAQAPVRGLVAGMGDALATFFEAEASHRSGVPAITGYAATRTALMVTRLCLDILMEYGAKAKQEVENGVPGEALEAVVEANILLSGLGYECGGLAAAHAIAGSFTRIHRQFEPAPYHGELVAFSTLTQLIMEGDRAEALDKVLGFMREVGLPATFAHLGLKEVTDEALRIVADHASKSLLMLAMPKANRTPGPERIFYDPDEIFRCLKETDAFGRG